MDSTETEVIVFNSSPTEYKGELCYLENWDIYNIKNCTFITLVYCTQTNIYDMFTAGSKMQQLCDMYNFGKYRSITTSNGIFQQVCEYNYALGVYKFIIGEDHKQYKVFRRILILNGLIH